MSDEAAVLEAREPSAKYLAQAEPALARGFELLATAHAGIPRLRELILDLAVRGVLVPQIPMEGLAATVLSSARAARAEDDVGRRARQTTRQLVDYIDVERGQLPPGWLWVSGADLFRVVRGVSYEKEQASPVGSVGAVPLLRANNIQRTLNFDDAVFVPGGLVAAEQLLRAGDYVVCMASGSKGLVGKAAPFLEGPTCTFGAFCAAVRPYAGALAPYLGVFLSSPLYRDEVSAESAGIGINNLRSSTLLSLQLPLPPLAEQHRIVARVEELMKLCDALEQSGRLADEQHARLTSTLFDALAASESAHALAENWQRIAEHFDLLLDRPEAIDALEQTILQLAASGRLVPQETEAAQGLKLHQLMSSEGSLFKAPSGWRWATLGQLSSLVTSGSRSWKNYYAKEGSTFIRSQDIKADRLEFDNRAFVKLPRTTEGVRTQVQLLDMLVTITGANVGKAAVLSESLGDAYVSQHVALVRLREPQMADFLHLWLVNANGGRKLLLASSYGAKPGLNLKNIKDLPVPLPPLAEQHRIVARVEELRRLCAQLRERLTAAQRTQSQLADALVATVG